MEAITDIIVNGIVQIIVILIALAVSGVTNWLKSKQNEAINRGQQEEVALIENIAKIAVQYAQQKFNKENGGVKFDAALDKVQEALAERGVELNDAQIEMFIEAAVKTMNDNNAFNKIDVQVDKADEVNLDSK